MKNNPETGMAANMLWAKRTLAAGSLYSVIEKGNTSRVIKGSAMIKPASSGRLPDSQEAKAITPAETEILKTVNSIGLSGTQPGGGGKSNKRQKI